MPDANSPVTLAEFAAIPRNRRLPRWSDCLSDDVVEQIMASGEKESEITQWLQKIGYPDATVGKVRTLVMDRERQAVPSG